MVLVMEALFFEAVATLVRAMAVGLLEECFQALASFALGLVAIEEVVKAMMDLFGVVGIAGIVKMVKGNLVVAVCLALLSLFIYFIPVNKSFFFLLI